ncbi:alpha/beta fold hydrolase [Curvivirga aplysinae]|uniref:alpha/beta fold hydrolase n=1 Tax=Curvivirga aplysinae TaxID=2529852 RepID=UPI0012BC6CD8|nr:alpha/beta hydrolase [Curvivirga aplysinae]MTI09510.1 alpha/beta hydrolase [Curvivirga aplysinae]
MSLESVSIQDEIITLKNGVNIAIRWYLPNTWNDASSKEDIVLLHEALGCIGMWRDFPHKLAYATGRRVMAYDREGYGGSSPLRQERNPDYLHQYGQEECPEVLEKAGITNPILFGHSDGGSIALLYAAKFNPKAIITEAGHVFVEDITVKGIAEAKFVWAHTDLEKRLAKYHGEKTATLFDAWAVTWLSYDFMRWNIEEEIQSITCPTLILQGAEDEYGSEKQVESILTHITGPTKACMIPNCRHIPHLQQQEEVLNQCVTFLKSL